MVGIEKVMRSEFGDLFAATALLTTLAGAGRADVLLGEAGNDTLFGGSGGDQMIGRLGH